MSLTDYLINLALIALVLRQIRGRRLTTFGLLWPVGLVVAVAAEYLHTIPTAGNDLTFALLCGLTGAVLGTLCGGLTRIGRGEGGALIARATGLAAALWVLGVGARLGFALYAQNGGGPTVARFSAAHSITGAGAWTTALLLMSLAEVLGRTVVLALRSRRSILRPSEPAAARG